MRIQIAYALIGLGALMLLFLIARSRARKGARPRKHLRIDLLAAKGDEPAGAEVKARPSRPS